MRSLPRPRGTASPRFLPRQTTGDRKGDPGERKPALPASPGTRREMAWRPRGGAVCVWTVTLGQH